MSNIVAQNCPSDRGMTLLFVGDLMQHSPQFNHALQSDGTYDYSPCFSDVKEAIEEADFSIGNLEVTFGGMPYSGYPCFSAPDEWASAIRNAGFDIVTTSNNHCLDRGRNGLERTLTVTESVGLRTLGTYRNEQERANRYPLIIEKNGIRVALIAYTYGMNGFKASAPNIVNIIDTTMIKQDLRQLANQHVDMIIALMHWGTEYRTTPDSYQKFYANWLLSHGVDHIIGGHPHVIEPTEWRSYASHPDHHLIVWSQGNFISNMRIPNTFDGTMITLTLKKIGDITSIAQYRCRTIRTTRPSYKLQYIN